MRASRRRATTLLLVVAGAAALVASVVAFNNPAAKPSAFESSGDVPDPNEVYDPVKANEAMPAGYHQVLGRDMIHPIYKPVFVDAGGVDWPENTDVIGVAGQHESKAYPVSHLSFRELVVDDIEGIPILVSW